jgi:hypothetical protein
MVVRGVEFRLGDCIGPCPESRAHGLIASRTRPSSPRCRLRVAQIRGIAASLAILKSMFPLLPRMTDPEAARKK